MIALLNLTAFFMPLILDQLSKWWILNRAALPLTVTEFIELRLTFNRGMSWSLLHADSTNGFILVNVIVIVALALTAWYTYYCARRGEMIVGQLFVLSGGISNIIDRIFHYGVVDFIHIHYGDWSWPIFNVADSFIVIGVCLMILQAFRYE